MITTVNHTIYTGKNGDAEEVDEALQSLSSSNGDNVRHLAWAHDADGIFNYTIVTAKVRDRKEYEAQLFNYFDSSIIESHD